MLRNRITKWLRMPDRGVNFWDATENLGDGEALLTQNCYWRRGIVMKPGSSKHSSTEVVSSKPILGMARFYYDISSKKLLAACDTKVRSMNDSTGAWTDVKTGLTTGLPTYFTTWGALNKCYVANGTDVPFSVDNSLTAANIAPANSISGTVMFCPYRDRLLSFDNTNPSYIRWSGSYDTSTWTSTAQALRVPGPGGITSISLHSVENTSTGVNAMVLIMKPSSIYLMYGTNLDPTATGFDARIDPIGGGDAVGCISPRTIVSTPKGTIFLGSDLQVYLLRYGSSQLIPIGHKIQSQNTSAVMGIESIPVAILSKACAIYNKGFYKLAVAPPGGTTNTRQYWLDIDRLDADERGRWGPWYGPMTGMSVSCFVNQNGSGDDGRLLGGEGNATGYVYRMNEAGTYTDDGAAIGLLYQSRNEPYSDNPALDVRVMQSELEMTAVTGTVSIDFSDTNGPIATASSISAGTSGNYWGTLYFGDDYWAGSGLPIRRKVEWYEKHCIGRFISTSVQYTSSTDALNLFSVQHEAVPTKQVVQVRP